MSSNSELVKRDLKTLWHPCTQMKDHEKYPLIPIQRAQGVYLEDFEGNRYLDAISSWWVNLLGHSNTGITDAIKNQLDELQHVIMAGFSHEPAIQLSEKLAEITPGNLEHCFFGENGSSAVEIALKMSFHYWQNTGEKKKTKFINLTNSYHGETLAALAVGDVALYKEVYQPLLMDVITVEGPDCFLREEGESWESHSRKMFQHMEQALADHAHEACAVIIEPLIQCAGNMRMYHPIYLTLLREACDRHGVHLIADEIAVGFGRTGTLFACEQGDIAPDFICLSKGLTGGYLPLSAVLTHDTIYQAFYDDYDTMKGFLHSHSFTGNPLGCSAALATIDLLEKGQVIEKNIVLSQHMASSVAHLKDHPNVAEIRQHGMVLAIEMVKDKASKTPYPWQERRGMRVYEYALKQGALLRPLGNVVYFMPPYIITKQQIDFLANIATQGIDIATAN